MNKLVILIENGENRLSIKLVHDEMSPKWKWHQSKGDIGAGSEKMKPLCDMGVKN